MEAKEEQRRLYLDKINGLEKKDLVYIDESGIDRTSHKNRGWGKKGKVLLGKTSGKRFTRTNIVAAQCGNKILAPMTFKGSCDTTLFTSWIRQMLVPELKSGQTIVMDNAAFHKSPVIKEIIEGAGCNLIYLPPYSPDFNPIEKFWANMKRWINQNSSHVEDVHYAIMNYFKKRSMSM